MGGLFHWAAGDVRTAPARLATAGAMMAWEEDTRPITQRSNQHGQQCFEVSTSAPVNVDSGRWAVCESLGRGPNLSAAQGKDFRRLISMLSALIKARWPRRC